MKKLLGIILIILGIAVGVYLGVWVLFIGGIASIINTIRTNEWNGMIIAIGIFKVISASLVGFGTMFLVSGIGAMLFDSK